MAVVVDPIVRQEKLLAPLTEQCEQPGVDYKKTLNIGKGSKTDLIGACVPVARLPLMLTVLS